MPDTRVNQQNQNNSQVINPAGTNIPPQPTPSFPPIQPSPDQPQEDSSGVFRKPYFYVSMAIVIVTIILGAYATYLYLQNAEDAKTKNDLAQAPKEIDSKSGSGSMFSKAITIPDDTYEPESSIECGRFTSLQQALKFVDQACTLDLSNQGLDRIPDEISSLTELTEVDLSNNNLSDFPVEILKIGTLTTLRLSNNNISSIPAGTVLPDNLQLLEIKGNPLSSSDAEKYTRTPDNAPPPLAPDQDITK